MESWSGLLLLTSSTFALLWANSPWSHNYQEFWNQILILPLRPFSVEKSCIEWINDGPMAIYFLVIALEIKREVLAGSLVSFSRAGLPILAAVGGIVAPAGVYALFALFSGTDWRGCGIPVATDVAFALGVMSVFGSRVPVGLKAFLTTLAIADDVGAITVIALFYASNIFLPAVAIALVSMLILIALNRFSVNKIGLYFIVGFCLWLAFLESGIQPTIAGVLVALTVPLRLQDSASIESGLIARLEKVLQPISAGLIVPLFAFANCGIVLPVNGIRELFSPITVAVFIALFLGKPIGILIFSWISLQMKIGRLPIGVSWAQIVAASSLGGIGFTVSLFIASTAFESAELLNQAKIGILTGSCAAAIVGGLLLSRVISKDKRSQ